MSKPVDNLQDAQQRAMAGRPKVEGFPYLAETLRRAGVTRNLWFLPACQSLFLTSDGSVVIQGAPLVSGIADVRPFDREARTKLYEPTKPERARFSNFSRLHGRLGLCGTMSTSQSARSPTMAAMGSSTSKAILPSILSRHRFPADRGSQSRRVLRAPSRGRLGYPSPTAPRSNP